MAELIIILISLASGSFANTIISYYLGTSKFDLVRSGCLCGERSLKAYELIPLASYIFLRGKCLKCSAGISFRYFLVEILFTISGILSFMKYGMTVHFILYFISFNILIVTGIIDYYKYIIPNSLVMALFILSLIKLLYLTDNILLNILSAAVTASVFLGINFIMRKIKGKDAIGFGDIKLLLVLMILTEFPLSLFALWLSALIAIPGFYAMRALTGRFRNEKRVPFGMFISASFIITSLMDKNIYSVLLVLYGN